MAYLVLVWAMHWFGVIFVLVGGRIPVYLD
jgi:hypothetical protein